MRRSNRRIPRITTAVALALATFASGCAAPASTPPPSQVAAPVVTPDPHLAEPASVDQLYTLVATAGIKITPNTASTGAHGEPIKRIVGTYSDWPIVLSQYSSGKVLKTEARFDPAVPPGQGEAPYIVVGLNILIEFGPRIVNTRNPEKPPTDKQKAMMALVAVLDPLLGPLSQRSVVPLKLPKGQTSASGAGRASAAPSPKS
jgi:hypothetical protein